MKKYCVDLEISKELKENGFPQNTLFMYDKGVLTSLAFLDSKLEDLFFAPNSDEILQELPELIKYEDGSITKSLSEIKILREDNLFIVQLFEDHWGSVHKEYKNKKLSNALAKMWIYLKKEGYLNGQR